MTVLQVAAIIGFVAVGFALGVWLAYFSIDYALKYFVLEGIESVTCNDPKCDAVHWRMLFSTAGGPIHRTIRVTDEVAALLDECDGARPARTPGPNTRPSNEERIKQIIRSKFKEGVGLAAGLAEARFHCGEIVREPYGEQGIIDAIYVDYQAAIDGSAVTEGWYEKLEKTPKTPKEGFWYAVILEKGAVLVGEDDLIAAIPAIPLPETNPNA